MDDTGDVACPSVFVSLKFLLKKEIKGRGQRAKLTENGEQNVNEEVDVAPSLQKHS